MRAIELLTQKTNVLEATALNASHMAVAEIKTKAVQFGRQLLSFDICDSFIRLFHHWVHWHHQQCTAEISDVDTLATGFKIVVASLSTDLAEEPNRRSFDRGKVAELLRLSSHLTDMIPGLHAHGWSRLHDSLSSIVSAVRPSSRLRGESPGAHTLTPPAMTESPLKQTALSSSPQSIQLSFEPVRTDLPLVVQSPVYSRDYANTVARPRPQPKLRLSPLGPLIKPLPSPAPALYELEPASTSAISIIIELPSEPSSSFGSPIATYSFLSPADAPLPLPYAGGPTSPDPLQFSAAGATLARSGISLATWNNCITV